jgi:hypothetical protein
MPSVASTHPCLPPDSLRPVTGLLPSTGDPIHAPGRSCPLPRPGKSPGGAVTRPAFSGSLAAILHLERHSGAGPKEVAAFGQVPLPRRP